MRPHFAALVVLLGLCFSVSSAIAQITNITDQVATPAPGAGHDYIGMLNEMVEPSTGKLSLNIKLPVSPGRKVNLAFTG